MKRIALLLCLLLCVTCFLPACKGEEDVMYDFPSLRINRYCKIEDSAWQNLSFSLDIASYTVSDEDVMEYMHELQASYLIGVPSEQKNTTRPIEKGDVVHIYYSGYADGIAFEGGCNMSQSKPSTLEIGSGQFIPGFEDSLIGVIPNQTSITKTTSGTVGASDLVYLAYTCKYVDDGKETTSTFTCQPVDLANVPASYGATFAQQLTGNEIGTPFSFTEIADFDSDSEQEHKVYNGTVLFSAVEQTATVSATFPTYYPQNQSLAGKTVTFKVVVEAVVDYIYPELTADFITNKLGYTATTADPVAEYKANVKTYLQNQRNTELSTAKESLIYDAIVDALTVKKWPKDSVKFFYDTYLESLTDDYDYYKYYCEYYGYSFPFKDLNDYIISFCEIEGATTAEQALTSYAEQKVKEQLVIFLLADKLDLKIKRSEKDAQAQIFADMLTQNDQSGKKYTAKDAYEEYGDTLIECSAMYNKVMQKLLAQTTFTQG